MRSVVIIDNNEKEFITDLTDGFQGFSFKAWDSNTEQNTEGLVLFCESGVLIFTQDSEDTFVAGLIRWTNFSEILNYLENDTCFSKVVLVEKFKEIKIQFLVKTMLDK